MTGNIDDGNGAAIVSLIGMVHEGHQVALRRNSRIADPAAAGLVEHLADGKLEPVAATHVADHGQAISVGGPICPFDIFENWPGCAARQRRSGQCAHVYPGSDGMAAQGKRHLTRR